MLGVFNTISLGSNEIYRGNDFSLSREYLYAGEVETCTGKRCADLVGWRYADLTVQWDALPDAQLQTILALTGEQVDLTFSDESNTSVTEKVVPQVIASTASRFTDNMGRSIWTGVQLQLQFIQAHNPGVA